MLHPSSASSPRRKQCRWPSRGWQCGYELRPVPNRCVTTRILRFAMKMHWLSYTDFLASKRIAQGALRYACLMGVNPSNGSGSKYPPAEPVALRPGPSKGPLRNRPKQKQEQSKSLLLLSSLPKHRQFEGEHTPGILKVLLPPRQSRWISLFD